MNESKLLRLREDLAHQCIPPFSLRREGDPRRPACWPDGRLVFAWDIYGSVNSVAQVYEKGVPDGTRKEILKQTGKINGGLLGARIGGSIGTAIGGVVIGVVGGTVGLPVLAVVGVIAVGGTLIGGYVGGVTGQAVVEYGYERLK